MKALSLNVQKLWQMYKFLRKRNRKTERLNREYVHSVAVYQKYLTRL